MIRSATLGLVFALTATAVMAADEPVGGDAVFEQAKAAYMTTNCDHSDPSTAEMGGSPKDYAIKLDGKPERTVRLISFPCFIGAYNIISVFYLHDEYGLCQVALPEPELDIVYENPEDTENSKVKSITIAGFSSEGQPMNAKFDPATNTISTSALWRGIGDVSQGGTWRFTGSNFVLVKYVVDATYDGEANSQTVIDYQSAP